MKKTLIARSIAFFANDRTAYAPDSRNGSHE